MPPALSTRHAFGGGPVSRRNPALPKLAIVVAQSEQARVNRFMLDNYAWAEQRAAFNHLFALIGRIAL